MQTISFSHKVPYYRQICIALILVMIVGMPAQITGQAQAAAPHEPYGLGDIIVDTTWTEANSPYIISNYVDVHPGVTLTIGPGVTVQNYASDTYNFTVQGTLIANGTATKPIHFSGSAGWSGIIISGEAGNINTGSILHYVSLNGGGIGGSGVGGDLVLSFSEVTVDHCQFNNSTGDGVLGDNATAGGVANIYESSFTNNKGFAVNFENGSVNPELRNLTATGNGSAISDYGNVVALNDGLLHGSHTWEYMGIPYLIYAQMTVAPDGILTIAPNVTVLVDPGNDAFDVQGKLLAQGTADQKIYFWPSDTLNGWGGIKIGNTADHPSSGNVLDYVYVMMGGSQQACGLMLEYGDALITHSIVDGSQTSGVCLNHNASLDMSDTQLINNHGYPLDIWDANDQFNLARLSASNNLTDTIGVEGGMLTGKHTWMKSGIDTYDQYYGTVTVAPTGTLVISPSVTVRFDITRGLEVAGTLLAQGTPSSPITMTGVTKTHGAWGSLHFFKPPSGFSTGVFKYVTIEYGGSPMVGIESSNVTFEHCVLRYSSGDAIRVYPDALQTTELNADMPEAQVLNVHLSKFNGNSGYAINNLEPTLLVRAVYNWWGSASGPAAPDNPGGTGNGVNGQVNYRPYLQVPNATQVFLPSILRK